MVALMACGVLAVQTAQRADPQVLAGYTSKQVVFCVLAVCGFLLASLVPYPRIGQMAYGLFILTLGLLVLVLFLPPIRECRRWIDIKIFLVQPSELAKLSFILALAWYLRYRQNYRTVVGLIPPFLLTVLPVVLILREPDLGTSLLLFPILFFMIFLAGAKLRHLLSVIAAAVLLAFLPVVQDVTDLPAADAADRQALSYWSYTREGRRRVVIAAPLALMKYYQLSRVDGWLRQADPRIAMTKGYHVHQSIVFLGSGGLSGRTEEQDSGLHLRMLPEDQTDFIFTVVGGQWGFLGCLGVLALYGVILACGGFIAATSEDALGRLVAVGVLALLSAQVFVNIGMTIGLLPVTGMTLPLVSYGGSSMVVNGLALGLLANVGMRRRAIFGKQPFEFSDDTGN